MPNLLREIDYADKNRSWSIFAFLTLTVFLILQISFLSEPVHVPSPEEIKHVEGKLLRTALTWNQDAFDAEMLVRSDDGDVLILVPSAAAVPDSIKTIDKNSVLSIDYYPITIKGTSRLHAWTIRLDGKPLVDYHDAAINKNQLREFDLKFVLLTAIFWTALLIFISITHRGKAAATRKAEFL